MRRLHVATACLVVTGSLLAAVPASASEDTTRPTAPTNLRLTNVTPYDFNMTWDPSTDDSGVAFYEVFTVDFTVETPKTSVTLSPYFAPKFAGTQQFYVRAHDQAGNRSDWSNELTFDLPKDTEAPTTPGNLRVTGKTSTTVTLAWDGSTDDWDPSLFYPIYELGGHNSGWAQIGPFERIITYLSPGTTYQFVATAKDGWDNESDRSNVVTVTTDP